MADFTGVEKQSHERPASRASSTHSSSSSSSSTSATPEASHDWVARQMKLYRLKFVETLNVKIKIVSWNVNGKRIAEDLSSLLLEDTEPGIYAIGLQEMDLGKGAYVVHDPSYEAEWTAAISSVLGDHYEKVASHQLIGIFLIVFANKALIPTISSVQKSHLPTGHFALLGNKGGTAIRLQCFDTTICFVNAHLYHVAGATARRTGDVRRILRDLVFDDAEKIRAHDHVFLFGDLNYRVSANTQEAKEMLDNGIMENLLRRDQLLHVMSRHGLFRNFHEAPINFPPTYKYDIGTNVFDTSEKNRCPSWTDRILWKSGLPVKPLRYSSFPIYTMSDHKPVSALFDVCLEAIIPNRFQEVHANVLRELDRLENDARPTVSLSSEELCFNEINFLEPITRSVVLQNSGTGIAHFEFHDLRQTNDLNQKDFIFIRPIKGSLGPKEKVSIDITILVGNSTIPLVAKGRKLDEILVLEIRNGRHIFLSLQGHFQRTCFGLPIGYLASFGGKGIRNIDSEARLHSGGGMPDELWRMTNFIRNHGQSCGSIFLERGDETLCRGIRESLDTAREFDRRLITEGEIGVLSMAETLLRFLEALPNSIIPENDYDKVIRIGENRGSIVEVMDVLPGPHANVLIYLMSIIRQIFEWPVFLQNPEAKRRIIRAFSKVLIRSPMKAGSEDTRRKEMLMARLVED